MAEQGEISGGIVEGPLPFDIAVSATAAKAKKVISKVAGDFDILVIPNLECGNILTKALDAFASAMSLGIILGAFVPIILTSRSASAYSRAGSCILAKFFVYATKNIRHC
jgi:phosphotransacetylase